MARWIVRRAVVSGAAALGLVLVPTAALAHDCIHVSRSERGSMGAAGGPSDISIHVKGTNGSDGVVSGTDPNSAVHSDGRGNDLSPPGVPVIEGVDDACDAVF